MNKLYFPGYRLISIVSASLFCHIALANPEEDRLITLQSLWGEYHYSNIFTPEEKDEIDQAISSLLTNVRSKAMLRHNLSCFGNADGCKKHSISSILENDPNFTTLTGNTERNQKAKNTGFRKWFFHVTKKLPTGSYPFANIFRAPFAKRLQQIVDDEHMDLIKISRQGIIPLYQLDEILSTSPSMEDLAVHSFIVVADFEEMVPPRRIRLSLEEHPLKLHMAEQLERLVHLTGFVDISVSNTGLESRGRRLVLFDTEPLYGETLLVPNEYNALRPELEAGAFDFYAMNRATLTSFSGIRSVISILLQRVEATMKRGTTTFHEGKRRKKCLLLGNGTPNSASFCASPSATSESSSDAGF